MEVRGGEEACDARLLVCDAPLVAVIDDDYGDVWEHTGVAARWSPGAGWRLPYE